MKMAKVKFNSKINNIFFTSDTHFCHSNVIKYCKRPFSSIEEMDEALINNWNSVVGPNDYVFHLGDFCFGGSDKWKQIISKLNGHIILIKGNHDHMSKSMESMFEYVSYQMYIEIDKCRIYLNHYPFLTYAGPYKKAPIYQLFGHVHSNKNMTGKDKGRLNLLFPTQYDVGVDNNNYTPVSWNTIKEKIGIQCKKRKTLKQKILTWIMNI